VHLQYSPNPENNHFGKEHYISSTNLGEVHICSPLGSRDGSSQKKTGEPHIGLLVKSLVFMVKSGESFHLKITLLLEVSNFYVH